MPQQGQRPNGLLTCERKVESHEWLMHTDSHSDVSLGLYSEISIYQEIEITTFAKSDTAFQNPSKSHDCHGPKGNVTTKAIRRISESFATLRCEDGEG